MSYRTMDVAKRMFPEIVDLVFAAQLKTTEFCGRAYDIARNTKDITLGDINGISNNVLAALNSLGISADSAHTVAGPVISRTFVKMNSITPDQIKIATATMTELTLKMMLKSNSISIDLDPTSQSIIVDTPNPVRSIVPFANVVKHMILAQKQKPMRLPIAIGSDVEGNPIAIDLADAPHMLVAGQTGSGKSVAVNAIISSLLVMNPDIVRMILIDPKTVEFAPYKNAAYLDRPIINDPAKAIDALRDVCVEMDNRKKLLAMANVRSIAEFNDNIDNGVHMNIDYHLRKPIPYLVTIIDEFADLMLTAEKDLVNLVSRITAVGRALGIHIILATQRPSVKVIPGEIKANIPTRIAFSVASQVDSLTILDKAGAEKLLGKGDMLLKLKGEEPFRAHGCLMSEDDLAMASGPEPWIRKHIDVLNMNPDDVWDLPIFNLRDLLKNNMLDLPYDEIRRYLCAPEWFINPLMDEYHKIKDNKKTVDAILPYVNP